MAKAKTTSTELEKKILNTLEMKKMISKVNKDNSAIREKMEELVETEKSTYYEKFAGEFERNRDLDQIKTELRHLITVKAGHLDSLVVKINIVNVDLSECERILSLDLVKF